MVAKNVLGVGGHSGSTSGQQPGKKMHIHSNSHVTSVDIPTGPSTQKHGAAKSASNSYDNMAQRDSHQRGYSHNSSLIAQLELKTTGKKQDGSESLRSPNLPPNIALNIANQVRQSHINPLTGGGSSGPMQPQKIYGSLEPQSSSIGGHGNSTKHGSESNKMNIEKQQPGRAIHGSFNDNIKHSAASGTAMHGSHPSSRRRYGGGNLNDNPLSQSHQVSSSNSAAISQIEPSSKKRSHHKREVPLSSNKLIENNAFKNGSLSSNPVVDINPNVTKNSAAAASAYIPSSYRGKGSEQLPGQNSYLQGRYSGKDQPPSPVGK